MASAWLSSWTGLVLSYSQLWDAAGRVTSPLSSLGIVPGDRVAVMLPNVPAFPIAFYGRSAPGPWSCR